MRIGKIKSCLYLAIILIYCIDLMTVEAQIAKCRRLLYPNCTRQGFQVVPIFRMLVNNNSSELFLFDNYIQKVKRDKFKLFGDSVMCYIS